VHLDSCAFAQSRGARAQIKVHASTTYLYRRGASIGACVVKKKVTLTKPDTDSTPSGHKASIVHEQDGAARSSSLTNPQWMEIASWKFFSSHCPS
jgi:hypothetical protein